MKISSRNVVEGTARSPHRAMYKAMGLTDDDLRKESGMDRGSILNKLRWI